MKILFIQDNGINESLALTELSALLKSKSHECELLIEKEEKNILGEIRKHNPELIVFPFGIMGQEYALRLSKEIKDILSVPIVFAGSHPTFYPEIIEHPCADIVCIGETDYSIPELADNLEKGRDIKRIKGLWVKEGKNIYRNSFAPLMENLDAMPVPDRELYYKYNFLRKMPMKRFSSGRGCVHSCAYCFNHILRSNFKNQKYTRKKSVGRMVEEISIIKDIYPLKTLHFSDDLFPVDRNWVKKFCEQYKKEIGLPFTFNSTADLMAEDVVKSVSSAGCSGVAIGIETGNERLRKTILNKNISNRQIIEAGTKIKKAGMKIATFNMLANPGETIEDAFMTMKLNSIISADNPRVTLSYPIKNSTLYDYAIKNGFLDEREFDKNDMAQQKAIYKSDCKKEFENLFYLFRFGCKHPRYINAIRKLIKLPANKFFAFAKILSPLDEKGFFDIGLLSGMEFYMHCGNPSLRTTNYTSVI